MIKILFHFVLGDSGSFFLLLQPFSDEGSTFRLSEQNLLSGDFQGSQSVL
jgi:hypothetical protein